jgi:hypothetical protein
VTLRRARHLKQLVSFPRSLAVRTPHHPGEPQSGTHHPAFTSITRAGTKDAITRAGAYGCFSAFSLARRAEY